jgi:hypothetical protein
VDVLGDQCHEDIAMKSVIIKAVVLTMGLALVGCGKKESEKPSAGTTAPAASGAVAVPDDGKKFDPPIKPEQLPSKAWYCDMGTVHYARIHEGDKTCPLCQMKLKQKP